MRDEVNKLVDVELKEATEKFGPFNSRHEGWAVIREEFMELMEDCVEVGKYVDYLDQCVRKNESTKDIDALTRMQAYAVNAAMEAIQVAAMAKRFKLDLKE